MLIQFRFQNFKSFRDDLIYFVRRKDFLKILDTVKVALQNIKCMRNVTLVDKNEFDCLFLSSANPGQQIKMRVMLFNLYSPE